MGYSTHISAVQRAESIFKKLLEATKEIELPTPEPRTLAYKLREGIFAAKLNNIKEYADLDKKWRFIEKPGVVICRPRNVSLFDVKMREVPKPINRLQFAGVESVHGIIGAAIENPNQDELSFPDVEADTDFLSKLYRWTSQRAYYIVYKEEEGLTLTKKKSEDVWQPS